MNNPQLIKDTGLFQGQEEFNFSLSESFETVSNIFRTIQEYRDYARPGSDNWEEYVHEIFHLLGFQTISQEERLFTLESLTFGNSSMVLVGLTFPNENSEKIVSWLDWVTFLSYAAKNFKIDYGILTNGLELKVYDFRKTNYKEVFFWSNLDEIIQQNRLDSFYTIYKVFSYIGGRTNQTKLQNKVVSLAPISSSGPKHTMKSRTPKSLLNVLEVYDEVVGNGLEFQQACKVIAERKGITAWTVRDGCTRKIGVNIKGFVILHKNKEKLIERLLVLYPDFETEIRKRIQ